MYLVAQEKFQERRNIVFSLPLTHYQIFFNLTYTNNNVKNAISTHSPTPSGNEQLEQVDDMHQMMDETNPTIEGSK